MNDVARTLLAGRPTREGTSLSDTLGISEEDVEAVLRGEAIELTEGLIAKGRPSPGREGRVVIVRTIWTPCPQPRASEAAEFPDAAMVNTWLTEASSTALEASREAARVASFGRCLAVVAEQFESLAQSRAEAEARERVVAALDEMALDIRHYLQRLENRAASLDDLAGRLGLK